MTSGRFITFEGGEGAGKSTQAGLLARRLEGRGIDVLLTREPGGSPFAERIRGILMSGSLPPQAPLVEALLFYAARADHLESTIRPALAAGRWVICDRFSDSTRVYQGVAGGLAADVLDALERLVVAPTRPDLTFILDIAPPAGLARAQARRSPPGNRAPADADPYESRNVLFHERLRAGYLAIAEADPQRCAVIDGARPADDVAAEIWALTERRLLAGGP
jgi:dTMP kinase